MRRNSWKIGARIALTLVGLTFLVSAVRHFIGSDLLFEHYEQNGIGGKNTWVVGLVQLFAAINLLIPKTQMIAAFVVCVPMSLAIFSHIRRGENLLNAWEAFTIFTVCLISLLILRIDFRKIKNVTRNKRFTRRN